MQLGQLLDLAPDVGGNVGVDVGDPNGLALDSDVHASTVERSVEVRADRVFDRPVEVLDNRDDDVRSRVRAVDVDADGRDASDGRRGERAQAARPRRREDETRASVDLSIRDRLAGGGVREVVRVVLEDDRAVGTASRAPIRKPATRFSFTIGSPATIETTTWPVRVPRRFSISAPMYAAR